MHIGIFYGEKILIDGSLFLRIKNDLFSRLEKLSFHHFAVEYASSCKNYPCDKEKRKKICHISASNCWIELKFGV